MAEIPDLVLPAAWPDEGEMYQVCINKDWYYVLMSLCERLEFDSSWIPGTDMSEALGKVYTLTKMFVDASEDCIPMPQNYVKEIVGCDNGLLETVHVFNGTPTTVFIPINQCWQHVVDVSIEPDHDLIIHYQDGTTANLGSVQGEPGEDGAQGAQGVPGPQGDPGIQGPQGEPGECEGCETQPPVGVSEQDVACASALYVVEWHDDMFDQLLNQIDIGGNVTGIIGSFIGLIPGVGAVAAALVSAVDAVVGTATSILRDDVGVAEIETLKCSLFCDMLTHTTYGADEFRTWLAAARAGESSLGMILWLDQMAAYTDDELNRRMAIGAASPSATCEVLCAECAEQPNPCNDTVDFTVNTVLYTERVALTSPYHYGEQVAGEGWHCTTGDSASSGTSPLVGLTISRDYGVTPINVQTVILHIKMKAAGSRSITVSQLNSAGTTAVQSVSQATGTRALNEEFDLTFNFASNSHYETMIAIANGADNVWVQSIEVVCR